MKIVWEGTEKDLEESSPGWNTYSENPIGTHMCVEYDGEKIRFYYWDEAMNMWRKILDNDLSKEDGERFSEWLKWLKENGSEE